MERRWSPKLIASVRVVMEVDAGDYAGDRDDDKGSTKKRRKGFNVFPGPRGFLPSLEYVEIKRPLKGEVMEMKLVSYFLEKSTILKKLTLCLDDSIKNEESVILKELLAIPRVSTSCQVVVL
ncbi:FBD domain [Arabidopsis suecica]|uniref:FBD domain n=1 Tax=Arabidopsis suecica TaxID=45249 RepID=A0A8T2AI06_ARASU|nr:FBD domain [Arabidopsis suecica]